MHRFGARLSRFVNPIIKYSATTVCVLAPAHAITNHVCDVYWVTGPSMSPTLSPDANTTGVHDWVLFRKDIGDLEDDTVEQRVWRQVDRKPEPTWKLERGMIVCFWAPHNPERIAIKRVIALEGDAIQPLRWPHSVSDLDDEADMTRKRRRLRQGHLLNHVELMRQAEAQKPREERGIPEPVTVPFGHVWVEGDNEGNTKDSNDFGPLSKSMVVGIATRILYPRARAGKVKWEADGWESRVGYRLKKRQQEEVEVPEEWVMHI